MSHARTVLVLIDPERWIGDTPWEPVGGDVVVEDATASPDEVRHRAALDRPTAPGARTARVADLTAAGE
ncbi:hypothetical protein ACFY3N_02710 [Streptomyces sp. NPDC000348]|uniref:hypothetical protein n=1 Tax=Streptomyces sp. NPDC000348 TaxID=3364538 RepID=UPI0036C33727